MSDTQEGHWHTDTIGPAESVENPIASIAIDARGEIEQVLLLDQSRLGDIYRWRTEGMTPSQMQEIVKATQPAFVYSYYQVIDAALDGKPVVGRVARRSVLGALNSLIKKARAFPVSPEAVQLLLDHRAAVESYGVEVDEVAASRADQEEREEAKKTLADLEGVPGIYAFSYGWYLEHPADEDRDTTFIKVGKAVNVAGRIREHMSGARAHMPEPLALVRVYSRDLIDINTVERQFHQLLSTAGHENPRRVGRQVGVEWFLTNTGFLDKIADVIGLKVVFEGQSEFSEVS